MNSFIPHFVSLPDLPGKIWVMLFSTSSFLFGFFTSIFFVIKAFLVSTPRDQLLKAERLVLEKNYNEAQNEFVELKMYSRASEMARLQGDIKTALELAIQGGDFASQGYLLATQKKYAEAAKAYDQARKYAQSADLWEKVGNFETALERYRSIQHVRKVQFLLEKLQRFGELGNLFAEECQKLRGLLGPHPTPNQLKNVNQLAEKAYDAFEKGGGFQNGYDFAIRMGNSLKAALFMEKLGQPKRAADLYRQANKIEKAAEILLAAKEFQAAIELYDELDRLEAIPPILELAGRHKEAKAIRAKLAIADGRLDEAAKYHEEADNFEQSAELAEQANQWERGAQLYEKAKNFEKAGELYEKGGEVEKALLCYEKSKSFLKLGQTRETRGDVDGAIRAFQNISNKEKNFPEAQHALARLFWRKGMAQLSETYFQSLIQKKSPSKEKILLFYDYACFLEGTGKLKEALAVYEKLLTIDFHYKDVLSRKKGVDDRLKNQTLVSSTEPKELSKSNLKEKVGVISERYEIREKIGSGGVGIVYLGFDQKLKRDVALKVLPPQIASSSAEEKNLLEEARLIGKLAHPNIVSLYDIGKAKGNFFLVMEYIRGKDLRKLIDEKETISLKTILEIAKQTVQALSFAHKSKVVHRDIKSANILLTEQGMVKIADFGLARVLRESQLTATKIMGSPYYMAPEQIRGDKYDHRVDLYSLGVVLFELIEGHTPFTEGEVGYHHIHTPVPPFKNENIPTELKDIVSKLLEKNQDHRFQTANEIVEKLEAVGL